ncbi:MAG: exodeoxyribonuclease III [Proteobacteria bacterium]|nr:exodeoxyribonuclease III [Pseudomonadota bacterium]
MKLATWNVNSIKARLPNVLAWLDEARPDIVLLQELKTVEENFPAMEIEDLGYNCAVVGQKSYNGVAILSRHPMEVDHRVLPGGGGEEQARYIEAFTGGLRVASIYLPNGNPAPGEKLDYKLAWMDRLIAHAATLIGLDEPVVLAGDYNICPTDADVYDPVGWADDALCRPESRAKFRTLLRQGWTEALRTLHPDQDHLYTFWDYQAGAWQRDNGLRIDHFLLSPQAADLLKSCEVDKGPRGQEKASDHTPVVCELDI